MKTIQTFLLLFALCGTGCFAQKPANKAEWNYAERGVIPAWVKNQTSPEEYQLWEIMSKYYRIDYSNLKSRRMGAEQKANLYKDLRNLCQRLESGEIKTQKNSRYSILHVKPDTLTAYNTEQLKCIKKKLIVYTSVDGYDAHVELTALYEHNVQTGDIRLWHYSVQGISFSGLDVKIPKQGEGLDFKLAYYPELKIFKGFCGGSLLYTDPTGEEHYNPVSVNFHFKP